MTLDNVEAMLESLSVAKEDEFINLLKSSWEIFWENIFVYLHDNLLVPALVFSVISTLLQNLTEWGRDY